MNFTLADIDRLMDGWTSGNDAIDAYMWPEGAKRKRHPLWGYTIALDRDRRWTWAANSALEWAQRTKHGAVWDWNAPFVGSPLHAWLLRQEAARHGGELAADLMRFHDWWVSRWPLLMRDVTGWSAHEGQTVREWVMRHGTMRLTDEMWAAEARLVQEAEQHKGK